MSDTKADGLQTIFCAVDFSETSDLALRHARALAGHHGSTLVLGHAVESLPIEPYPPPMTLEEGQAHVRRIAEERLDALAGELREEGLRVDTRIAVGPPGPQLVDLIRETEASLAVIGTRGQTGLQHLLLGSTAEHVVRRSLAPVLTIHPTDQQTIEKARRVVVPTDLSEDAEVALDAFLQLFPGDALPRVDLVYADAPPPYLRSMSHELLAGQGRTDERREEIEGHMAPLVQRLRERGFEVGLQVVDGSPVEAVTGLADVEGADLIVMSTHGRSAIANALLGRTAQRVVQRAPCPVLTVCPKRRRSS